jgi:hypothetical protein
MYLESALNNTDRLKWKNFLVHCQKIVIIRKDFRPIQTNSNEVPLHLLFEVYNFEYYNALEQSSLISELDNIFVNDRNSSAYSFARIVLNCLINQRTTRKTPIISTLSKKVFMNPWFWIRYINTLKKETINMKTPLNNLKITLNPMRFMCDDSYKQFYNDPIAIDAYHRARNNTIRLFNMLERINIYLTYEDLPFTDPGLIRMRESVLEQVDSYKRVFGIMLLNNLHVDGIEIPQHMSDSYENTIEFWENFLWNLARV